LAEQALGGASDVEQEWLLILSMRTVAAVAHQVNGVTLTLTLILSMRTVAAVAPQVL